MNAMTDYRDISHRLAGLWPDILSQYGIEIPKMRGINSENCPCPLCGGDDRAHFREVAGRLCLFCRACAADSMHSPEHVIMEYAGIDFPEFVSDMALFINHIPIERIEKAQRRVQSPNFNLPPDDARNAEKSAAFIETCTKRDLGDCVMLEKDGNQYLAITTFNRDVVNVAKLGRDIEFLLGGVSYGAFSIIKKTKDKNYFVVASPWQARSIAEQTGVNVMIAWSPHNLKFVCRNAPKNYTLLPVLTSETPEAAALCDEADWCYYWPETKKLVKQKQYGTESWIKD